MTHVRAAPRLLTAADLAHASWAREFIDRRTDPPETGWRCLEYPRLTMIQTAGRANALTHYCDGRRIVGTLGARAEALNQPHDVAGAPERLETLLLRLTGWQTQAAIDGTGTALTVQDMPTYWVDRFRSTLPAFEGLPVLWGQADA